MLLAAHFKLDVEGIGARDGEMTVRDEGLFGENTDCLLSGFCERDDGLAAHGGALALLAVGGDKRFRALGYPRTKAR